VQAALPPSLSQNRGAARAPCTFACLQVEEQGTGCAATASGHPGLLEDQESATKRQFFEYICTSYRYFLAGDDARCARGVRMCVRVCVGGAVGGVICLRFLASTTCPVHVRFIA